MFVCLLAEPPESSGNTTPPSNGGSNGKSGSATKSTGSGNVYARSGMTNAAKCFRTSVRGCSNGGWFNAPGRSDFTDNAKSVYLAGDGDCAAVGGTVVGDVTATCSSTAKSLTLTVKNIPGAASTSDPSKYGRHFYVSCTNPSQCLPPRFGGTERGAPASVVSGVANYNLPWGNSLAGKWPDISGSYYGAVRVSLGNSCSCSNVRWVVQQSGPNFYYVH
jgi:hypothetical protein